MKGNNVLIAMFSLIALTFVAQIQADAQSAKSRMCAGVSERDRQQADNYIFVARTNFRYGERDRALNSICQALKLNPCLEMDRELKQFFDSGGKCPAFSQQEQAYGEKDPSGFNPGADENIKGFLLTFEEEPSLTVTLTAPIVTSASRPFTYQTVSKLVTPLRTGDGEILIPADTDIPLEVKVFPGKVFKSEGRILIRILPFIVGANDSAPSCSEVGEGETESNLHSLLCKKRWQVQLSSHIDMAQVPEHMGGRFYLVKKGAEYLAGNRRPISPDVYNRDAESLRSSAEIVAYRNPISGIIYDVSRLTVGSVGLLFSRRNLYLPTETRVTFKLGVKMRFSKIDRSEKSQKGLRTKVEIIR